MRLPLSTTLPPWSRRLFHPAVAATGFGAVFGVMLLRMQSDPYEIPLSYSEPVPRAAVFERAPSSESDPGTLVPADADAVATVSILETQDADAISQSEETHPASLSVRVDE